MEGRKGSSGLTSAATTERMLYNTHYYDYDYYHHSANEYFVSPQSGIALKYVEENTTVYYESAASLSRSFCFDNAFILRM